METDRELLELAAKAAGIDLKPMEIKNVTKRGDDRFIGYMGDVTKCPRGWFSPLTDDGDALRLAVKLYLFDGSIFSHLMQLRLDETRRDPSKTDEEIMRRAIVRAAAEIGKTMKGIE